MSEFKAMKFRVKDADHSAALQEALFSLGYIWYSAAVRAAHTASRYLYAETTGRLSYGDDYNVFLEEAHTEHYLEDIAPAAGVEQPPLGLRPAWLVAELRVVEIIDAMKRYADAGTPVPAAWVVELSQRFDESKVRENSHG